MKAARWVVPIIVVAVLVYFAMKSAATGMFAAGGAL